MRCFHCMNEVPGQATFCPYCGGRTHEDNPPYQLAAGTVLHDIFLVGNAIGEDVSGITYIGLDKRADQKVAVKEFFPARIVSRDHTASNEVVLGDGRDPNGYLNGRNSFLRQAKSLAQFTHEAAIDRVRGVFTENNTAYMVTEYPDGVTLSQYLDRNGTVKTRRALRMLLPLMRMLHKLHTARIVHCDVSPDNIMVMKNGALKLMGFGMERRFLDDADQFSTESKQCCAPVERFNEWEKEGAWTDVYGLCATLYRCLTGVFPPRAIDRTVEDTLQKPSALGVNIPEDLEDLLMKGLAVYPADRLRGMDELIAASEAVLGEASAPKVGNNAQAAVPVQAAPQPRQPYPAQNAVPKAPPQERRAPAVAAPAQPPQTPAVCGRQRVSVRKIVISIIAVLMAAAIIALALYRPTKVPQPPATKAPALMTIDAGDSHTVALRSDGTVVATGSNKNGECNVGDWKDITTVSAGGSHTVGLKADGTVVATGDNKSGACDVGDWKDIVAVSAGDKHTVGLKADGTVVATGSNKNGECDVKDWVGVIAVSAGGSHTVGLGEDGTVIATGKKDAYSVKDWRDITAVSAGGMHTVGLHSNGKVVARGKNEDGQIFAGQWEDIVAVSAGHSYTIGLRSDGTVVTTASDHDGIKEVAGWKDIVAISAGRSHAVGLRSDGTVVATGENKDGQCDVTDWKDIKIPSNNE